MIPKSIRWRLPLSYAAIALLTALALGALLLTTLRGYYRDRELDYLTGNAQAISTEIGRLLRQDSPLPALQAQLTGFAFLSQTRVRLLDADGNPVADSGSPDEAGKEGTLMLGAFTVDDAGLGATDDPTDLGLILEETRTRSSILIVSGLASRGYEEQVVVTSSGTNGIRTVVQGTRRETTSQRLISRLPVSGTPFGFGLNPDTASANPRSNLVVRQAIEDVAGNTLGVVELSQGPAYGTDILRSVAWGWAIASGVAVVLAAVAGWFISLRLSTPLLALKEVTTHMAGGDLSPRAHIERQDELGDLSRSFNKMADRVEDTVSTLRHFVADAAHQLHTPLTALRTDLELLAEEIPGGEDPGRVCRAQLQVSRLEALTTGLLDLSKLESLAHTRPQAASGAALDLNQVIQSSSELYASRAEQAGLSFSMALPDEPITLPGDEAQLRQAIGNLLDNAIKFTPEGGSVEVSLQAGEQWATVTVADTGIGIHHEDMDGLFGRFHRGRNVVNYPGSGLGLAIVKAIVEAHGGRITGESDGEGTRFELRLPLAGAVATHA